MNTPKHPRQQRSTGEHGLSPHPEDEQTSSWRAAAMLIAAVFTALLIVSFIFLRMPMTADVAGRNGNSTPRAAGSSGSQAGGASAAGEALANGATSDHSTAAITWIADLPYGTHGSPRLFRDDDSAQMIIAFGNETKRIGGAMGIDVDSGVPRWHSTSQDEMFTLPMPLKTWSSGEAPWIVGGRNGQLICVDARSGKDLWKSEPSGIEGRGKGVYNFFTGRPIDDVDGDGADDFLVPNGGDSLRGRFQSRPPGHLFVVSGASGALIHRLPVPDQRETYFSPLYWNRGSEDLIVFGSGGETFPGSLWTVPRQSVQRGTLDGVRELVASTESKGAIAPPSFADLDSDGVLDLVAVPFDGRLIVISGRTLATLWQFAPTGVHETQSSPAIADFDGDGDLDVAYVTQYGVFPRWTASQIRVFDGISGDLLWEQQINGDLSAASPLALDIDGDQKNELFFIHANPALFRASMNDLSVSHLKMVHVDEGRIEDFGAVDGFNAGTGWIGDADDDGQLDWMIPLKMDGGGGRLVRVDMKKPTPESITWGGYLGTQHDGTYHAQPQHLSAAAR